MIIFVITLIFNHKIIKKKKNNVKKIILNIIFIIVPWNLFDILFFIKIYSNLLKINNL